MKKERLAEDEPAFEESFFFFFSADNFFFFFLFTAASFPASSVEQDRKWIGDR